MDNKIINLLKNEQIQCHQESLIGAIQNIISNGIEAAEETQHLPSINITLKGRDNNVCIAISDNGPGIKKSQLKKLTEPFYTTKSNGTGLGLPVVNAVMRAHHGFMDIHNLEEGGACFELRLPDKNCFSKELINASV